MIYVLIVGLRMASHFYIIGTHSNNVLISQIRQNAGYLENPLDPRPTTLDPRLK